VTNSRDRVQRLIAGGQMPPDVGQQVLAAIAGLATVRLKAHLETVEQNDAVRAAPEDDVEDGEGYVLTDTELELLKRIVKDVIPALADVAQGILARPPQAAAPKAQGSGGFEISRSR
jgi:hypothetical protein